MKELHDELSKKHKDYGDWHKNPIHPHLHWAIFLGVVVLIGAGILSKINNTSFLSNLSNARALVATQKQMDCAVDAIDVERVSKIDKTKFEKAKNDLAHTNNVLRMASKTYNDETGARKKALEKLIRVTMKERQSSLLSAMDNGDTATVLSSVYSLADVNNTLSSVDSNCFEKHTAIEGTIAEGHTHFTDFSEKNTRDFYVLDKGNGEKLSLFVPDTIKDSLVFGKKVSIDGYQIGKRFIASSTNGTIKLAKNNSFFKTAEANVPHAYGQQKVIIMAVKKSGSSTPSTNFNTILSNLNSHVSESSLGRASMTGAVAGGGWINVSTEPCTATPYDEAIASVDSSVNFTQYTHILWLVAGNCGGGTSIIGAPLNYDTQDGVVPLYYAEVAGSSYVGDPSFYIHEIEHTFGLQHASSYDCPSSALAAPGRPSPQNGCTRDEYGNPWSMMGGSSNLIDMTQFDFIWGSISDVINASTAGTYTIEPRETVTGGAKAIRIPYANNLWLYAEYRQPGGTWDSNLAGTNAVSGALVLSTNGRGSNLLDPTPPGSTMSSALQVGQTFTAPVTGATIKLLSKTTSNATLEVNPGTPDLVNPTISNVTPAGGSSFPLGSTVNFSASGSDNNHLYVMGFADGSGTWKADDYSAPYTASWNTSNGGWVGTNNITISATDDAGNFSQQFFAIQLYSGSQPTLVTITSPASGSIVSGPVTVLGNATSGQPITWVNFWMRDDVSSGPVNYGGPSNPFTMSFDSRGYTDGVHAFYVEGLYSGGIIPSNIIYLDIRNNTGPDTTPPVISNVNSNSVTSNSAVISWATNESANSQVGYGTTSSYGTNWPVSPDPNMVSSHNIQIVGLSPGTTYHYQVKSADQAGNNASSSDFTFTTTSPDTTAPTVSITNPTNGATVSNTITISANASDNVGVDHVDFYVGTTQIGADASNPYSISWNTTSVANGTYNIFARAYDSAGNNATSSSVLVTVNNVAVPPPDTTAPVVSMTTPSNGGTVSGSIAVGATATDNVGVTRVEFYDGSTLISSDTTAGATGSDYAVTWNTSGNGSHTLKAKAFDAAGNNTTSSTITVTVNNVVIGDTTPPNVTITSPTSSTIASNGNTNFTATASDPSGISGMEIKVDGVTKKTCASPATTCTYKQNNRQLTSGSHTITATAFDGAGNLGTATKTVTK